MQDRYTTQENRSSRREWHPNTSNYRQRYKEDIQNSDREQRGVVERSGAEVRAWFGDEGAEQRRMLDERYDRERYSGRTDRYGEVRAREVMTCNVMTVHPYDAVEQAAHLMDKCDCGSLPVVNDKGRLIGIVTDRDIALRIAGQGKDPRRAQVEECMSINIVACHENVSIKECMRQMSRHQIRRLPIVDDRDHIVGIVSQSDLAWHAGTHPGWGERRALADVMCAVSEPTHTPRR